MNIYISNSEIESRPYEFVERKGSGHPDTLSDRLAEYLSAKYSKYTKERFGAVLHHNFDKLGLLGGASDVGFGYGELVRPIKVLVNGRASNRFGDDIIDTSDLLRRWVVEFMTHEFPTLNESNLDIYMNLSTQSSPGKTKEENNLKKSSRKYWFEPRGLQDLPELSRLFSNDTSMGVGFYPYTKLENLVLRIENTLNSYAFRREHQWIGSDIKIMGFRFKDEYKITMCVPQIGRYVQSLDEYKNNIQTIRGFILSIFNEFDIKNGELNINTRDNYEKVELYLTAIGSSIESGDEGLVGRGNRIQGIIAPMRPMSMEGAAGKNPVYHIGKLYYIAAQKISEQIYNSFNISNDVALVSQSGRDLLDPWLVFIRLPIGFNKTKEIEDLVMKQIADIPLITEELLDHKIPLC